MRTLKTILILSLASVAVVGSIAGMLTLGLWAAVPAMFIGWRIGQDVPETLVAIWSK